MAVQRCTQCGTARRGDLQVCVRCETSFPGVAVEPTAPVDLDAALPRPAAPSQTQSHGTVLAAVLLGFVVLAVLLRLSIRGIGPFEVRLVDSTSVGDTLRLTLEVTNNGERTGRANCRIPLRDATDVVQAPTNVVTRPVEPGDTITQVVEVPVRDGVRPFGTITC